MTERSGAAMTPPLKLPTGVVMPSGSRNILKPRGGRALMIAKAIRCARRRAAAAWARGVSILLSVSNVPSTSETTAEIFVGIDRLDVVMTIDRCLSR